MCVARSAGAVALLAMVALSGPTGCASTPVTGQGGLREDSVQVGYGARDRDKVTGAVSSHTVSDREKERGATLEEMLQRIPGVQVARTGSGGLSLRIRGTGSFYSGNEPLVIVDGVPLSESGLTQSLGGLVTRDIERIDVLKDASETAIYGLRGANGVVIITTRRPR